MVFAASNDVNNSEVGRWMTVCIDETEEDLSSALERRRLARNRAIVEKTALHLCEDTIFIESCRGVECVFKHAQAYALLFDDDETNLLLSKRAIQWSTVVHGLCQDHDNLAAVPGEHEFRRSIENNHNLLRAGESRSHLGQATAQRAAEHSECSRSAAVAAYFAAAGTQAA